MIATIAVIAEEKKFSDRSDHMGIKFFLLAIAQSNFPLFLYTVFNGIKQLWDEAAFPKLIIFLKN